MPHITFKAKRTASKSCDGYRGIDKGGALYFDWAASSDDVISLIFTEATSIKIDCDKKTGTFRLMFNALKAAEAPHE